MQYILGIDFDNTLVSYDEVVYRRALDMGLITPDVDKNKKAVRDYIRLLPEGEKKWKEVQAHIYGKGMIEALLFDGVKEFFKTLKLAGIPVYIISHKSQFATPYKKGGANLRKMALAWMKSNGFFEMDSIGLSQDRVYFESTREEKINRIKQLGCTHFIDDLVEILTGNNFPDDVEKILFASSEQSAPSSQWKAFSTWGKISEYFSALTMNKLTANEVNIVEKLLGTSLTFSERIRRRPFINTRRA